MSMDRRRFLKTSALGLAATAAWLEAPSLARADGVGQLLQLSERPLNYESVRSTFITRITPLDRFFLRNHFDIPEVNPSTWRLRIAGLVDKQLSLSLADLERMPQVTVEAVMQCAGNGRALFEPRVPGVQWRWGAMGNSEWTGVRLRDVLALARPKESAAHLQLQGADRPTLETTPLFIRGVPLAKGMHPDTLVALKQDGRPLTVNRGRPARLVVPGWVADDWVRFLTDVELRADEPKGFYYETAYRFPSSPGAPGVAIPPAGMGPMTAMNVKSILGSLSDGQLLRQGNHELRGVAFSGEAGIEKVEVSVDGGSSWVKARLEGPSTPHGFRVFRHPWKAEPGRHRLAVRATDTKGVSQPETALWNPSGYLFNAWDRVEVEVRS